MEKFFINKPLEKRDYSFVVLPDTQNIIENKEEYYLKMMRWIRDNKEEYNIKAVIHMGDIVNVNTDKQWEIAKEGFDYINSAKIPFIPMMGNHDDPDYFHKYVKYEDYSQNSWFGGTYSDNNLDQFYYYIKCDKKEYIVISLGWAPSNDVLKWAGKIIDENCDKNIIISTHALMHRNGKLLQKEHQYSITSYPGYENNCEGYEIWENFKDKKNVLFTLSGHISSSDISVYYENNIPSLLFDNQDEDKRDHLCMMGLLSFNNNECFINWYSFGKEALYKEENQFAIKLNYI